MILKLILKIFNKLIRVIKDDNGDSIIKEVTGEDSLRKILPLFEKTY